MNQHRAIKSLLVANRGEIACRIMRSAKQAGMRTIAVYSTADATALHVKQADIAVCIGTEQPTDSYLKIDAIVKAAIDTQADAIHPGYGFLSENPNFVEACNKANIIFVGPGAEAMRAMGLKDAAKVLMEQAGVPVVPGYHGENQAVGFLRKQAAEIGFPVLIKARAGGGGKGMRKVDRQEAFDEALVGAQREAQNSFGDAAVLIEKYIEHPRHIEVQVFGDTQGNVVHLFERDCSLQRRHQKVLEESPAPDMTNEVRDAMTSAAVKAAETIHYVGAGTVEFIVDASGPLRPDGFWFMEMNTRLQVEHPVTEAVTGIDLVSWQLQVASGQPIPLQQHDITLHGHAIETRLYAEDVEAGFLPATGTLIYFAPSIYGRVDSGVTTGDVVYPYYDPMLAKLVTHAAHRDAALSQMQRLLDETVVFGVVTNRQFLSELCGNKSMRSGHVHTGLIDEHVQTLESNRARHDETDCHTHKHTLPDTVVIASVAAVAMPQSTDVNNVFSRLGAWQQWGQPSCIVSLGVNGTRLNLIVTRLGKQKWRVISNEQQCDGDGDSTESNGVVNPVSKELALVSASSLINGAKVEIGHRQVTAHVIRQGSIIYCQVDGKADQFELPDYAEEANTVLNDGDIVAPMPGRVISINCHAGDGVKKGQTLVTIEAMKMEHNLTAPMDGSIASVHVSVDEQVELGQKLVFLDSGANSTNL